MTLPCCILSANDIVKLTAPVVARRVPEVPFFLQRDPIVCDALAIFDKQPDANNEEVVPKEPGALQHVSIDDAYKLVAKPTLLLQRPVPESFSKRRTSAKFNRTDWEEANPKLAAVFRKFRDKPGKPWFNAARALAAAGLRPVFEALLLGLAHVVLTRAGQTNKARASSRTKRIVSCQQATSALSDHQESDRSH